MRLFLLLTIALSASGATLTISPPVIYDCAGTFGKASLSWTGGSGPVRLVVGPANVPMTNLDKTFGLADTGTWVSDGLEFRLLNASGAVEALAVAKVRCTGADVPANGLIGRSYFPLEVGNTWVYRSDSRFVTSDYVTWKVTNLVRRGGLTYSEISAISPGFTIVALTLREDSSGTIWRFTGTPENPKEEVYLNPQAERHAPFSNSLGSYPDAVSQTTSSLFDRNEQVFIRGIGLANARSSISTGSNGGFSGGLELVEVRLATGPRIAVSSPRVAVVAENVRLDVTNRLVTNCAIPCYYAACGIGSPVDPPNTWKPCTRTRLEANASADFSAELSLVNSAGQTLYKTSPIAASAGELVRYVQVPLYSEANKPYPAGAYKLMSRVLVGGAETATSSMIVEIQ
ncbi:MAG: hypothetical protein ABI995_06590 [Acidobacteriota bacterium]